MTPSDFGDNWTKWDALMQSYCETAQVPWRWMKGIMIIESSLGLNPRVAHGLAKPSDIAGSESEDGLSWGLLQLRPETARDFDIIANAEKLNDPDYSISMGSKLLRRLYRGLGGIEEFVIKGWNEGQGAALLEQGGKISGRSHQYWARYIEVKSLLPAEQ
jgi:hypothetical protein